LGGYNGAPMTTNAAVRILPDSLINKIAAGEVVERPASVVKELVENAIDAGASSIRVDVRGGGKSLVSVRDDGRGMSRDDALLAIERHATSKIRRPEDLFAIHTLGFRGEALPSIAQVSRMEIRTAEHGAERGTHLRLDGGVLKAVKDAPPVPGTEIQVRRLFFNIPVRLRFLKGERTELGHVTEAVVRAALARPAVRFELWRGERQVLRADGTDDLVRRVGDVLGRDIGGRVIPLEASEGELRLHGLVSEPALTRSSRNGLYLFVNGRPVRDRLLLGAVLGAYRGLLPRGRFPVLALFLQLPAGDVDHNVHPTKSEVRFVRARQVYRFVADSLGGTLRGATAGAFLPDAEPDPPPTTGPPAAGRPPSSWGMVRESLFDGIGGGVPTPAPPPAADSPGSASSQAPPAPDEAPAFSFRALVYLGGYEGTYLLFQDGTDLVVIDQHAAHERINYERILASDSTAGGSQHLLVPETIDLPRAQAELLSSRADLLASVGVELGEFGGGTVVVTAVPPSLSPESVRELITDLAQELVDSRPSTAVEELRHRLAAVAACHRSVRAHQRLSEGEIRSLLTGLDGAELPFTCPHGRPLLARFRLRDVQRWFDRT
jgi:DNA mismatch repair protein MutL